MWANVTIHSPGVIPKPAIGSVTLELRSYIICGRIHRKHSLISS